MRRRSILRHKEKNLEFLEYCIKVEKQRKAMSDASNRFPQSTLLKLLLLYVSLEIHVDVTAAAWCAELHDQGYVFNIADRHEDCATSLAKWSKKL